MPMIKKMKCVLYVRVSSDEQINNFSLATQEDICRSAAERLGYTVDKVYSELGESAKTADRPELIKLFDYCHKNRKDIASVLVYRFDRVARNTMDHLSIRAKLAEDSIKLESASEPISDADSPTGKFLETVLASMNELDNSIRAEKARNGMRKRFMSGLIVRPPLGYVNKEVDGKKVAVPDENFNLMKKSWEILSTGTKTLTEMADVMNHLKLKSNFKGTLIPITKQLTSTLFRNKFYCGYIRSRKYQTELKGIHTPMITEEMFYRVQGIISGKYAPHIKKNMYNPLFPLRGIVKCDNCGRFLTGANVHGRTKIYPKYWCQGNCIPSTPADDLKEKLLNKLSSVQFSEDMVNLFTIYLHDKYDLKRNIITERQKRAESEILEQKRFMTLLVRGDMEGKYPRDIYDQEKKRIEDKLLVLNIVKNDSLANKYDIDATVNFIKVLLKDITRAYKVSSPGQAKVLIGSIYDNSLSFDGKDLLNHSLGLGFEAIKNFAPDKVFLCAPSVTRIEPILSFFQTLMQAYPDYQTQFAYAI